MKKLALLLLTFAAAALAAAPWDGTKGNITISTIGDGSHAVISVSDADQTVSVFSVTVSYVLPCAGLGCTSLGKTSTQFVTRIPSPTNPRPALAIFDIPDVQIKSVLVSELHAGTSESFAPAN